MREARIHVRHVRDLLKSIDYVDAYAGQECSSLAFLNVITQGDILGLLLLLYFSFNKFIQITETFSQNMLSSLRVVFCMTCNKSFSLVEKYLQLRIKT